MLLRRTHLRLDPPSTERASFKFAAKISLRHASDAADASSRRRADARIPVLPEEPGARRVRRSVRGHAGQPQPDLPARVSQHGRVIGCEPPQISAGGADHPAAHGRLGGAGAERALGPRQRDAHARDRHSSRPDDLYVPGSQRYAHARCTCHMRVACAMPQGALPRSGLAREAAAARARPVRQGRLLRCRRAHRAP